jgi:glutathione S-transferase
MRCYGSKPDTFLRKVPSGLLPVLELDGAVITESAQIMEVLEREFPETPMMPPAGTTQRKCEPAGKAVNYRWLN